MDFQKLWKKILYISENPIWAYELFVYWWLGINKHHWTSFLGNIPEVLKVPEKLVPVFCAPWGRSQVGKGIWGHLPLCLVRLVESWKLAAPCPLIPYSPLLSCHWTNPLGLQSLSCALWEYFFGMESLLYHFCLSVMTSTYYKSLRNQLLCK